MGPTVQKKRQSIVYVRHKKIIDAKLQHMSPGLSHHIESPRQ
jgi:hypothetical protein